MADPLGKRLEGLRQFLDFNLPKGISYLVQAARTLIDAYAESQATPTTPPSAPPSDVPANAPTTVPTPAPETPPARVQRKAPAISCKPSRS